MRSLYAWTLAAALALCAAPALAQGVAATVEGIQMPAWVERDGRRTPLVPGMELKAGDVVHTGEGSRLAIKLAEGSLVKLGQNGSLRFAELDAAEELFKGLLDVLEGAFRFTTEAVGRNPKRQLSIKLAQVTAGIRGTDLWGRSSLERQIVCLIEGRIDVAAEGEPAVTMSQPRQFYQREYGQTLPPGSVEPSQLAEWARETDIEPGKGAARRGGRWNAVLASSPTQGAALAVYDELRGAGYPAEIFPTPEAGRLVYVVLIRRMPSRAEALALGEVLRGRYGITSPRASQ